MATNNSIFSADEYLRYSRHLQLPKFGAEAQIKLKNAHVVLVGMGGLGAPVSLYLAAAGVGEITLIDGDRVDITNLQRQVIYRESDVGQYKVDAAKAHLSALNSHINIRTHSEFLSTELIRQLADKRIQLVIDCSDNMPTRYLINDWVRQIQAPWLYAGIHQYSGQLAFFEPGKACYRCLFPEKADNIEDCNSGGVIGVLPGLLGIIQATEAIKYLADLPLSSANQLTMVDALTLSIRRFALTQNPQCRCQETNSTFTEDEYHFLCENTLTDHEISAEEFHRLRDNEQHVVLDVRSQTERSAFHIGGEHLALSELAAAMPNLNRHTTYICLCQSGKRSLDACKQLRAHDLNAVSVAGGIANLLKQ